MTQEDKKLLLKDRCARLPYRIGWNCAMLPYEKKNKTQNGKLSV